MTAFALFITVLAILYVFWLLLREVFALIDQWHARADRSAEVMSPNMEREH